MAVIDPIGQSNDSGFRFSYFLKNWALKTTSAKRCEEYYENIPRTILPEKCSVFQNYLPAAHDGHVLVKFL